MVPGKSDIWERRGSTGILTLESSKGNYLDRPDFIDPGLLEELFHEPGLKGVIIRGPGRHFSAGADMESLRSLANDPALLLSKMESGKKILNYIENSEVPVVAAIGGICFGGGLEIALACHLRVCSENAVLAFPEVNHGIMPGLGGTIRLRRIIGQGKAVEMLLTGDTVDADKALSIGLVDHISKDSDVMEKALKIMDKMTSDRDIGVIRAIMRSISNALNLDREKALEEETRMFCELAVRSTNEKH